MYSLWQDLWHGTIIFDLVTLILKFDLLLKNLNLCRYLVMVAARQASLSSDNSYFLNWWYVFMIFQPPSVKSPQESLPKTSPPVGLRRTYAPATLQHPASAKARQEDNRRKLLTSELVVEKSKKPRIKSAPRLGVIYSQICGSRKDSKCNLYTCFICKKQKLRL